MHVAPDWPRSFSLAHRSVPPVVPVTPRHSRAHDSTAWTSSGIADGNLMGGGGTRPEAARGGGTCRPNRETTTRGAQARERKVAERGGSRERRYVVCRRRVGAMGHTRGDRRSCWSGRSGATTSRSVEARHGQLSQGVLGRVTNEGGR
jgi:hypothetical protein